MRRLAAFLLLVLAAAARADVPPMPIPDRVLASDVVITGTVEEDSKTLEIADGRTRRSVSFSVEKVLLGDSAVAARTKVSLCWSTGAGDAPPGVDPRLGDKLIVFLQLRDNRCELINEWQGVEPWSEDTERRVAGYANAATEARAIEGLARYESSGIGYAGTPGEAYTRLERILALKEDASPFLRRLAVAKNPVARIVAVVGCTVAPSEDRLRVVLGLLADDEEADCIEGCLVGKRRVREYAKDALARYPDNQRIEGLIRVLEGAETGSKDAARAALVDITKQELGDDAAKWRAWWNAKRSK